VRPKDGRRSTATSDVVGAGERVRVVYWWLYSYGFGRILACYDERMMKARQFEFKGYNTRKCALFEKR
jgi:hypothetical protein